MANKIEREMIEEIRDDVKEIKRDIALRKELTSELKIAKTRGDPIVELH